MRCARGEHELLPGSEMEEELREQQRCQQAPAIGTQLAEPAIARPGQGIGRQADPRPAREAVLGRGRPGRTSLRDRARSGGLELARRQPAIGIVDRGETRGVTTTIRMMVVRERTEATLERREVDVGLEAQDLERGLQLHPALRS